MAEFELTDGRDRIRGTRDDDTYTGGAGTLSRNDFIQDRGGEDVLVAGLANDLSGAEAPRLFGIETLFINAQGGDLSLRNVRGTDAVYADQTSIVIEDATLNVAYGARGVESGTVTVDFRSDLSGDQDTLSLISEDANVTFKARTDEQNSAIERIELEATGEDRDAEQVDVSAFNELQELAVTGQNRVILDLTSPELGLVDATENTGGVELDDLNSASQDVEFLGSEGDDLVRTGTGDDLIEGNEGDDDIDAEAGNDTVIGGEGDDTLAGNAGADTIEGGEGDDEITGGGGADEITGGAGDDDIRGGNDADTIEGGEGADTIRGGGGDDEINGGAGENLLFGNGGDDTFVFTSGTDTVRDFTAGSDTLAFSDGTSLSTQQDFIDLQGRDPDAFANVGADSVTLEVGGATVTILEFDTDFLMG